MGEPQTLPAVNREDESLKARWKCMKCGFHGLKIAPKRKPEIGTMELSYCVRCGGRKSHRYVVLGREGGVIDDE